MDPKQDLDPSPPPRRPRGFAAAAEDGAAAAAGKGRKEWEREKERTRLRERHRRAITSRMLAGLRQHGRFPLPARADMNDVVAALAREAGWVVEPDGTTYRPSAPAPRPPPAAQLVSFKSVESPSVSSLKNQNHSTGTVLDCEPSILGLDDGLSPGSFDSIVVVEGDMKDTQFVNASPINSSECMEDNQLMHDIQRRAHDGDFSGTPYVPFFVMLPISIINGFCQLVDPESVTEILHHLKSMHIDGVSVSCWWGIVENWSPQKYVWSGYRDLFNIIREFKIKLQVVMAFHEGGSGSCEIPITLPKWVMEIGRDNQDIFFTDREGRRNTECLSWGIDKERVLKGRTGIEVYFDFMRSFRMEFDDLFVEGLISSVEIGLGASGELKYPSFSESMGWKYPGIGEFQCYDKYLQQNLRRAAKIRGHSFWARGPDNAGHYNSRPHETGFFCDRGDYDSYYGHFFLQWYAQTLINHADNVLSLANLVFEGTQMAVKIPAVFWWYRTASHPAELAAGFYNPTNRDGYVPVFDMLHRHSVIVKITCLGSLSSVPDHEEALTDPDGLTWQLLNSAWDRGLLLAGQNAFFCRDRESCIKFLETAKLRDDPDSRHFSFFTFQLASLTSIMEIRSPDLHYLVKCMHGINSPAFLPIRTMYFCYEAAAGYEMSPTHRLLVAFFGRTGFRSTIWKCKYLQAGWIPTANCGVASETFISSCGNFA